MSSTNRGVTPRAERDFYETPEWLTWAILPFVIPDTRSTLNVLEPSAGNGKIVRPLEECLQKQRRTYTISLFDIDPGDLIKERCNQADFLEVEPRNDFHLIIQNPPFTLNREFIEHSLKFLHREEESVLVSLSRIGFLGSQKRYEWWKEYIPDEIYLTPRRPKFRGNGNDSEEFIWKVWRGPLTRGLDGPPKFSKFYWLDTAQKKWRRKL